MITRCYRCCYFCLPTCFLPPPPPGPPDSHGVATLAGQVWAVGGWSATHKDLASVEVYDPVLNTWQAGVPLPHACYDATCAVLLH